MPKLSLATPARQFPLEHYDFMLDFEGEARQSLARQPLTLADFRFAVFAAQFQALQHNPALHFWAPDMHAAYLEPRFIMDGHPLCNGFRVIYSTAENPQCSMEFDQSYFRIRASQALSQFLSEGRISQDHTCVYSLVAYPAAEEGTEPAASGIVLQPTDPHMKVIPCSRQQWSPTEAWDAPAAHQLPVLIARHVIDEVTQEAAAAPTREIGGLLLGQLMRDDAGALYLLVRGHVPGGDTLESEAASVTFTPASFHRGREYLTLRAADFPGEMIVGQYHSHPMGFCEACPLPTPPECVDKILFFSPQDHVLMQAFEQPFMLGMIVGVERRLAAALQHAPVRLFGWHQGTIQPRGFEVIDV